VDGMVLSTEENASSGEEGSSFSRYEKNASIAMHITRESKRKE